MNNKFRKFLSVFAVLGALTAYGGGPAWAAGPWFVSPSGNDGNNCTASATACQTISGAIAKASSGDTINVAAGTYAEQIAVDKKLTINGSNSGISAGAAACHRGSESIVDGGFYIHPGADGTVVDGFTVENGSTSGSHNNAFTVGDANGAVLNVTIQNNIIKDVTTPAQSGGIEAVAGANNLTIKDNNINNNWRGIYLNPSDGVTITGNIIDSNNGSGVGIGSSGQSNLTISGNIISNNSVEGWGIDTVGVNVVAHNNSFTGNGAGVDWYGGTTNTIDATNNWWGAADGPGDVGPGSGDSVNSTNVIFDPFLQSSPNLAGVGCPGGGSSGGVTAIPTLSTSGLALLALFLALGGGVFLAARRHRH